MTGSLSRRRILSRSVKFLALVGGLLVMVPLVSFVGDTLSTGAPSPILKYSAAALDPGEIGRLDWRGRPVWVYRAARADGEPRYTVFYPFENLRGCKVHYLPAAAPGAPKGWPGGFGEPCFGALFDDMGRLVPGTGRTGQTDLQAPPHHFDGSGTLILGIEG